MKSLLMLLLSINFAFAGLFGQAKVGQEDTEIFFSILDYGRKNHVYMNIFLEGEGEHRHRQVYGYIPIETYHAVFNTEESLELSIEDGDNQYDFKASGPLNDRSISITTIFYDDDKMVAQKEITTIKLTDVTADIKIEAFRRKQILFYVGKLRKVETTEAFDLPIDRSGVGLFGDNRGWPLGKVNTIEGLIEAGKDTSTEALRNACQVEC